MARATFDGFSIDLPPGWSDVVEDATYADPDEALPVSFAKRGGAGTLYVRLPYLDEDDVPRADAGAAASMARAWGERRGVAPLAEDAALHAHGALAHATYRLGEELVELWVLLDGRGALEATYVCAWPDRDRDRGERDAAVAGLRFA